MTRIIISHIRKCHGNYYEGAGGYELKIAQSGCFLVFLFCVCVCVRYKGTKNCSHPGYFFSFNCPLKPKK